MSETKLIISPRPPCFSPCFSGAVNSTLSLGSNPWRSRWAQGSLSPPCYRKADFSPHLPTQLKKCSPVSLGISARDFERTFRSELNLLHFFLIFFLIHPNVDKYLRSLLHSIPYYILKSWVGGRLLIDKQSMYLLLIHDSKLQNI